MDVWNWLHLDELGFTFQALQYKQTWSRLNRMYVMYNESFLLECLQMSMEQDVVCRHIIIFPFFWAQNTCTIDMCKYLLERVLYDVTLFKCLILNGPIQGKNAITYLITFHYPHKLWLSRALTLLRTHGMITKTWSYAMQT